MYTCCSVCLYVTYVCYLIVEYPLLFYSEIIKTLNMLIQ